MRNSSFIVGIFALVVSAVAVSGPVYQWRDAEGNMHFSDQPPKHVPDAQQAPLQTDMPSANSPYVDHPYSIQKQVEFFQSQQEKQQRIRLEQQMARHQIESASRATSPLVMPPLDGGIPPIVPVPRYQQLYYPYRGDYHRRHRPRRHGEGASLNLIDTGDHHRLHLNLGYYNRLSPELYHRLRYWNFRR